MNNKNKKQKKYINLVTLVLVLISTAMFAVTWGARINPLLDRAFLGKGNYLVIFVYAVIFASMLKSFNGLKISHYKLSTTLMGQFLGVFMTHLIMFVILMLVLANTFVTKDLFSAMWQLWAVSTLITMVLTIVLTRMYGKFVPPYQMLEFYGDHQNQLTLKVDSRKDLYHVQDRLYVGKKIERPEMLKLLPQMHNYDAVLINDVPSSRKNTILKYAYDHDIRVYMTPKLSDIMVKAAENVNLFDSPLLLAENEGPSMSQLFLKRAMDIICSALAMIILSPLLLVISICIKASDGGSVIYKQKRVTLDGKEFWIYKFRSMIENAEADGNFHPAEEEDPRITKVGKFIRKTRIDELPQLWNIFVGDMSIVGPRPERVEHVEKYTADIPEFSYRLKMRGGLTGYAQVYGRYNTTAYDKLKMDLMYIANYSLILDFQILAETLKVVFQKESTSGFSEEQIALMKEDVSSEEEE